MPPIPVTDHITNVAHRIESVKLDWIDRLPDQIILMF